MTLEKDLLKSLKELNKKNIGVAVSGGIDSMSLLYSLTKLKPKLGLNLTVFHYNHNWRKESKKDYETVKIFCKEKKLPLIYKETKGQILRIEENARKERYSFFNTECQKRGISAILTAHHLEDQAETILFRLCRGTGPEGFVGINKKLEAKKNYIIFRPFLNTRKKDILHYARKNKIPYREDSSNKDITYKRNYIRKEILPRLEKIHSSFKKNICRTSDLVYNYSLCLNDYFKSIKQKISNTSSGRDWNREAFLKLPKNTQRSFLYWFLNKEQISGSVAKLDLILSSINNIQNLDLSKNLMIHISFKKISFKNKGLKKKNKPFYIPINTSKSKDYKLSNGMTFSVKKYKGSSNLSRFPKDKESIAYVDLSITNNLILRYKEEKDKFMPLGLKRNVSLRKFCINKKIPKEVRDDLPILYSEKDALWIPGYAISEKIKVANKPTHTLELCNK